ncbi:hypothetical protein [Bacteroides cellulosilyticus]|nr:hypothetical protein [Bacteroides cellulosilyticus]MBV3707139.1 hypothetical protein [Bacteroides cellulosilyticus]
MICGLPVILSLSKDLFPWHKAALYSKGGDSSTTLRMTDSPQIISFITATETNKVTSYRNE